MLTIAIITISALGISVGKDFVRIGEATKYVGAYADIIKNENVRKVKEELSENETVEFKLDFENVSFAYPGSNVMALDNISFSFDSKKRYGLVGANGSGKTTLVKLLLRLYDVTEGEILVGGTNIKNIDYSSYLKIFAPVFQDYILHSYSVRENISFEERDNDAFIWTLLERQGLYEEIKNSPDGLDTFITKELDEDGRDFSGGQKQRLAMVRALYKNAGIFVLDEPTSAIDPLAEFKYFESLRNETQDKTAIYITHRMASAKYSDSIVVLNAGEVVEQGNFEELISANGIFGKLFGIQASYYEL